MGLVVDIKGLSKTYKIGGEKLPVLKEVYLSAGKGSFISVIGPSGCGKSTLFRTIAGLEKEFSGTVMVNEQDIRSNPPRLAYMFQKDLLLPWRTVIKNIVLPLELSGKLKEADIKNLEVLINEFGLAGFENAYPHELSGGMRQRAALLRTWLMDGDIILLDEPFGALDALTRINMQDWLIKVWENHRKTVLFITHDIEEAVYLSDRIFVMSKRPGTIIDNVAIEFERPRNRNMLYTEVFLEYKKRLVTLLKDDKLL
ncbi:MAG: ABC transporter ATP-binding protein [Clostridiaceae bacterium]|jgi:putative hydroxymethylpyrimidine transport system ATP-binding protein|nr:ABC transporter ATP-binding protein [Clostridiaceae bacterium]